jgi:valyl-tRNA synthetase
MIDLETAGLVEKIEDYVNKVGHSERTDAVIEPKLSMQWFVKMETLAKPALEAVESDYIKYVPAKFKNLYRHWMTNIKDWCISRQLWWGHQIPAYYLPGGGFVVAETKEEALAQAISQTGNNELALDDLKQDPDCLDTWFSSWLWPISLFNGILEPDNAEFKYYYPTTDLVTAPDIIFFWVSRMIIAGYEFCGDKPFSNVYFTGIVRDKLGRKMSKSLGNSPDPLELIEKFGADGVRMGIMLAAPAGHDIMYDDSLCEQGRNFCNKIWNAFRLVKGWNVADIEQPVASADAVTWFKAKLAAAVAEIDDLFSKFRISEALMVVYKLFWDEFSSWYLEMVKPAYGSPIDKATYTATLKFFDDLLRLLHPFMPFITEELWQHLQERAEGESVMYAAMPGSDGANSAILESMECVKEIVIGVRSVRASKNIAPKQPLELRVVGTLPVSEVGVIEKLANLSSISNVTAKDPAAASFMVGAIEFNVPLEDSIDVAAELAKMQKDLEYYQGFLVSVNKKLSNERFVANAPAAVVDAERRKQADAEAKIAALTASMAALSQSK